jgi:hypothetical protein
MSPPEVWGPPIWALFHTLAEKIHEDKYLHLGKELVYHIRRIAAYLPCPDCSLHATQFFSRLPAERFSTKKELKHTIFVLHNSVNKRKNKPLSTLAILDTYKNKNVVDAYNNFIRVYKTRGNMKLLTESFQRQLIVSGFKRWLLKNIQAFR